MSDFGVPPEATQGLTERQRRMMRAHMARMRELQQDPLSVIAEEMVKQQAAIARDSKNYRISTEQHRKMYPKTQALKKGPVTAKPSRDQNVREPATVEEPQGPPKPISDKDIIKQIEGFNKLLVEEAEAQTNEDTTLIDQMGKLEEREQKQQAHDLDQGIKQQKAQQDQEKHEQDIISSMVQRRILEAKLQQTQQKADAEGGRVPVAEADASLGADLASVPEDQKKVFQEGLRRRGALADQIVALAKTDLSGAEGLRSLIEQFPEAQKPGGPIQQRATATRARIKALVEKQRQLLKPTPFERTPELDQAENMRNELLGRLSAEQYAMFNADTKRERIRAHEKVQALEKRLLQAQGILERVRHPLEEADVRQSNLLQAEINRELGISEAEFREDLAIRQQLGTETAREFNQNLARVKFTSSVIHGIRGMKQDQRDALIGAIATKEGVDRSQAALILQMWMRQDRKEQDNMRNARFFMEADAKSKAEQREKDMRASAVQSTAEEILIDPEGHDWSPKDQGVDETVWQRLFKGGSIGEFGVQKGAAGVADGFGLDSLHAAKNLLTLERTGGSPEKIKALKDSIKENLIRFFVANGVTRGSMEHYTKAFNAAIAVVHQRFTVDATDPKNIPSADKLDAIVAGRELFNQGLERVVQLWDQMAQSAGIQALERLEKAKVAELQRQIKAARTESRQARRLGQPSRFYYSRQLQHTIESARALKENWLAEFPEK